VHVSSTEKLTLLVHDRRRGQPAISGIDILPSYKGVCVHDGFSSYDQYQQCRHAQCNAHILRELNYVIETSKARWAVEMKALLLEIKAAVDKARGGGRKKLPPRQKGEFQRRYDEAVGQARKLYGSLRRRGGRAKRRKPAESPIRAAARKLARRLEAKREEVLLFMIDFRVPFDRYERRSQRQRSPVPPNSAFASVGLVRHAGWRPTRLGSRLRSRALDHTSGTLVEHAVPWLALR